MGLYPLSFRWLHVRPRQQDGGDGRHRFAETMDPEHQLPGVPGDAALMRPFARAHADTGCGHIPHSVLYTRASRQHSLLLVSLLQQLGVAYRILLIYCACMWYPPHYLSSSVSTCFTVQHIALPLASTPVSAISFRLSCIAVALIQSCCTGHALRW